MSNCGFVYLLANPAMPCYYKIGCTSVDPRHRAAQLSAASGVPAPFSLLLYVRIGGFQLEEQWLHSHLADFRPIFQREFFLFRRSQMPWVRAIFKEHPRALEYVECDWTKFAPAEQFDGNPWIPDQEAPSGLYLDCAGCCEAPLETWELEIPA